MDFAWEEAKAFFEKASTTKGTGTQEPLVD